MASQVVATGNGNFEIAKLAPGRHMIELVADDWGGATVVLESASEDDWEAVDDPYNSGNDVSRTANGPMIGVFGGVKYRIAVSNYSGSGTTSGLRMIASYAGS